MANTPDTTVYVEPRASRSILEWTPDLFRAAKLSADAGNLELAADFWESAMADDRVQAAISTRTKGLVGLPLSFEAVRGTKRLVKALEAGEDFWAAYPSTELAQLLAWGIGLGIGVAQQVWTDRGSTINRIVPKLKVWHPRFLRFDWDRRIWQVRTHGERWVDVQAGDGTWILYTPYGESRPWAWGAWRAVALWHLLKQFAIQDWGNYSSKSGEGRLVATGPDNWSKEKRKEVAEELFGLAAGASICLPAGVTLALLESEANTYQTFVAQKDAADMGIAVAVLGQNLSTEVSGPASTGATLHGRVLQTFIDSDAETLSTCLHDQSLRWWAEFNFGGPDLAPWPIWDTKPPEDKRLSAEVGKSRAETAKTLASVGIFTVNEVRIAAGQEPLKEGGDEVVKTAPAPAPGEVDEPEDEAPDEDSATKRLRRGKTFGGTESICLRSGRSAPARSGMVQGQLYADAVADAAIARAAEILNKDVNTVIAAINDGESYEDVRKRLVKAYKAMSPDKLADLTEAAVTMAELAGRHAINEDT